MDTRLAATLLLTLGLTACAGPESDPLSGPAFDEDTGDFLGEEGTYVMALTYLKVRNAPGPGGRFGDRAQACGEDLFANEPDGFLGGAFQNIGRLQQFTMTVWESEEQMLQWVTGPVHAPAMQEIGELASEAKATLVEVTEADLPFAWQDTDAIYDELGWYEHPDMRSE